MMSLCASDKSISNAPFFINYIHSNYKYTFFLETDVLSSKTLITVMQLNLKYKPLRDKYRSPLIIYPPK